MLRWVVVPLALLVLAVATVSRTPVAKSDEPFVGCHCCPEPAHCNPN